MIQDTYKTIADVSEGLYTEKRSKFIAVALPVKTVEEIKEHLEVYQKKYYDARHVCYAYMLGHERKEEPEIVDQLYDMDCRMTLRIRRSCMPRLRERLLKVETARLADQD